MSQDGDGESGDAARRVSLARSTLAFRRLRERHLPGIEFADPAWDILLDLYIAGHSGRTVSVSSLCLAAGVPQTTALRWIKLLTDRGMLQRHGDATDRRRVNIALTPAAHAAVGQCLDAGAALIAE